MVAKSSAELTEITAVVQTVRAASIADTLFTFLELLEQAEVTRNWCAAIDMMSRHREKSQGVQLML